MLKDNYALIGVGFLIAMIVFVIMRQQAKEVEGFTFSITTPSYWLDDDNINRGGIGETCGKDQCENPENLGIWHQHSCCAGDKFRKACTGCSNYLDDVRTRTNTSVVNTRTHRFQIDSNSCTNKLDRCKELNYKRALPYLKNKNRVKQAVCKCVGQLNRKCRNGVDDEHRMCLKRNGEPRFKGYPVHSM